MTLGQRVAQKRKELGLSQEGLGERLGVSRQAIYKWESDTSLPEIDKLITLSKIFSVPVGWLLGVEEAGSEHPAQDQERLVEDILSRYQAFPQKSVWDKWSVRCLFALCGIMLALLVGTSAKVKEMEQRYDNLCWSIDGIAGSVDSQISAATRRMEESLKEQTDLTSHWSVELTHTDFYSNSATFTVQVTPKTFEEGMTALFTACNGIDMVEQTAEPGPGHTFSGEITCPLSNKISLSVSFLSGGTAQTQLLRDYFDLYNSSGLSVGAAGIQTFPNYNNHTMPPKALNITVHLGDERFKPEPPASLQVGLFRERKLVQWFEPGVLPQGTYGSAAGPCWTNSREIVLEDGDYCTAALYTDESGRQMVYYRDAFRYDRSANPMISTTSGQAFPPERCPVDPGDPGYWTF